MGLLSIIRVHFEVLAVKNIICMVYGLRELKNKSQDNSEWVINGEFFFTI